RLRDHHEPGREPHGLTPQLSPDRAAAPHIIKNMDGIIGERKFLRE
ncbi:hypothetical protein PCS70012_02322, partial [Streptococcus pneumoniae PCS70012]